MPELKSRTVEEEQTFEKEPKNTEDELRGYDSREQLRFWNWIRRNIED